MEPGTSYRFLRHMDFVLPYQEFGNGPELLLAFHGFGRSGEDFRDLAAALDGHYTVIAFDFFYHGPHGLPPDERLPAFTGANLSNMIEKLLWEKKKVRCSLLGYSQGGRIVLGQVHHIPHRIHELFVLAPDGLRRNRIREFAGKNPLGRILGYAMVKVPGLLAASITIASKLNFIRPKVAQFFLHNTRHESDRYRIYNTWILLRDYRIHKDLIRHYFKDRPIRVAFIMGKYDAIIPTSLAQNFLRKMKGDIQLKELECGHDLLQLSTEIAAIIKKENSDQPT